MSDPSSTSSREYHHSRPDGYDTQSTSIHSYKSRTISSAYDSNSNNNANYSSLLRSKGKETAPAAKSAGHVYQSVSQDDSYASLKRSGRPSSLKVNTQLKPVEIPSLSPEKKNLNAPVHTPYPVSNYGTTPNPARNQSFKYSTSSTLPYPVKHS